MYKIRNKKTGKIIDNHGYLICDGKVYAGMLLNQGQIATSGMLMEDLEVIFDSEIHKENLKLELKKIIEENYNEKFRKEIEDRNGKIKALGNSIESIIKVNEVIETASKVKIENLEKNIAEKNEKIKDFESKYSALQGVYKMQQRFNKNYLNTIAEQDKENAKLKSEIEKLKKDGKVIERTKKIGKLSVTEKFYNVGRKIMADFELRKGVYEDEATLKLKQKISELNKDNFTKDGFWRDPEIIKENDRLKEKLEIYAKKVSELQDFNSTIERQKSAIDGQKNVIQILKDQVKKEKESYKIHVERFKRAKARLRKNYLREQSKKPFDIRDIRVNGMSLHELLNNLGIENLKLKEENSTYKLYNGNNQFEILKSQACEISMLKDQIKDFESKNKALNESIDRHEKKYYKLFKEKESDVIILKEIKRLCVMRGY